MLIRLLNGPRRRSLGPIWSLRSGATLGPSILIGSPINLGSAFTS